jgi:flagellar basal-body rod modification protein FlgD
MTEITATRPATAAATLAAANQTAANQTAANQTTSTSSTAKQAATTPTNPSANLGRDAFLKLLVAQLRYQNPLEPSDPGDFMAQTAQFTMVESLEELSKASESTAAAQRVATASSLVGRTVSYIGGGGTSVEGSVVAVRLVGAETVARVRGATGAVTDVPLASITEIAPAPAPAT